jgi:hypothetical protein
MDRTIAQARLDRRDDLRLLCPDCFLGQADALMGPLVITPETAALVAERLGTTAERAAAWLLENLRRVGVIVAVEPTRRRYWLPGQGRVSWVLNQAEPGTPARIGGPRGGQVPMVFPPEISSRSQARTRGLRRLRPAAGPPAPATES